MPEIDPITGLPKELGVWENLTKENQKITIYTEKKKFNKFYTIVEGIDQKEIDLKDLGKKLKSKLACGGTIKDGKIELQGNHTQKTKKLLITYGFDPNSVEIK
jgi:translation initiation factor 1